jgi:hypothetical protein
VNRDKRRPMHHNTWMSELPAISPLPADEPLAEVSPVTHTDHHPGKPLETQADRDAQVDDVQLREGDAAEPIEYGGIDTSSAELNYASRSNIVPDPYNLPAAAEEQ